MTATITQSGLFAFAGIHVCHLTEGDTIKAFDRLPLHYSPTETVAILPEYIDELLNRGWISAPKKAAPTAPVAQPEGETAKPEEKAADPLEANKAAHPVTENKAHKAHKAGK